MSKEFKDIKAEDPTFLEDPAATGVREVRHLIFSTKTVSDLITVSLCGSIEGVNLNKTEGVTCVKCRETAEHLSTLDSYEEAISYVESYAPELEEYDLESLDETHAGQPTRAAIRNIKALEILQSFGIESPGDIAGNILGSTMTTYYWNMVELYLLTEQGDPDTPNW